MKSLPGVSLGIDCHKDKLDPFFLIVQGLLDVTVLGEGARANVGTRCVTKEHHNDVALLFAEAVHVAVLVHQGEIGGGSRRFEGGAVKRGRSASTRLDRAEGQIRSCLASSKEVGAGDP